MWILLFSFLPKYCHFVIEARDELLIQCVGINIISYAIPKRPHTLLVIIKAALLGILDE